LKNKEIEVINKLGLHARAAAKLVSLASGFSCDVLVSKGGRQVNGKSIMGIMMLAASQHTTLKISTNGEDEQQAIAEIESLFLQRFGEED
jgi:phosphocarrier protein HPr